MNTTTRRGAICAGLLLAVLIVGCGDDDDDDGRDTGSAGTQVDAELDAAGPQAGALICIQDTSAFPTYPAANRVYEVVDRPGAAAAADQPQVWIDFDTESTAADVAVSVKADYLRDIADEVDDEELAPGDSC